MGTRLRRQAAPQRPPPQRAPGAAIDRPDMAAAGDEGKKGGPVAALGRNRQVVALREPQREREALPRAGPLRHRHHPVDVRIAGQNPGGPFEHERVNDSVAIRAPQACGQRRGEKHVAEPAQRDHQDARSGRQIDRGHGSPGVVEA
jgi:hypothetical protein